MARQLRIRVAIVGGGISGIATAIRLKEQLGERIELTILEKAAAPGGVWRDSRWPGAGVDVPVHLYSLYSDLNSDWSEYYASQPEVLAYWERLVDKHKLRHLFWFNTEYVGSEWSDVTASHTVHIRDSAGTLSSFAVEVLVGANGPLSRPLIPNLPGLDTFEGVHFHNLRWRSDIDLSHKRVAVVGNGSSGVQLVPGVAALPGVHLTHFIRSGGYFMPKLNYQYSTVVKLAFRWLPGLQRLYRFTLFVHSNLFWKSRLVTEVHPTPREIELLSYLASKAPTKYLPLLQPDYPFGCKRPAFNCGWLESLHRDNVDLVRHPIVRVNETGLVTEDGTHYPADVIVFATGSDVARHGVGINVNLKGEQGVTLEDHWKELGGPQAYLGVSVPGFPNVFQVLGPNSIASSWGYTLGVQSAFIAQLVKALVEHDIASLQPTNEAFKAANSETQAKLVASAMNSSECANWWRVGGKGLVSVTGWRSGFELAKVAARIEWSHWTAKVKIQEGVAEKLVVVDVQGKVRRQRVKKTVAWSVPVGLAVFAGYTWARPQ